MTPEDHTKSATPLSAPQAPRHDSRRRLLRGGLAAAPALLTLVNRPVMAYNCSTMSGHSSMNLSRASGSLSTCSGASPAIWSLESSAKDWPAPAATPDMVSTVAAPVDTADAATKAMTTAGPSTLNDGAVVNDELKSEAASSGLRTLTVAGTTFNSVFGNQGGYDKKTLTEVLRLSSNSGRDGLARHLVAAYLNALKGLTPSEVLDVPTIKSIWTSFVARGYYEPTAGIRWFPDYAEPASPRGGLIAWLKTTMPR